MNGVHTVRSDTDFASRPATHIRRIPVPNADQKMGRMIVVSTARMDAAASLGRLPVQQVMLSDRQVLMLRRG